MKGNKWILMVQALICVLLTGLLSFAALSIYRSGLSAREAGDVLAWIYTPEAVRAWVPYVLPLVLLSLAVTVYASVKGIRDENADKPVIDQENLRDLTVLRKEVTDEMKKEEQKQRTITIAGWAAFAVLLVPVLLYFTRPTNFPQSDLEGMFKAMASNCLPWMFLAIAALAVSFVLKDKSLQKEIELSRQAPAYTGEPKKMKTFAINLRTVSITRIVVLVLALAFIIMGIANGGARDVLIKAVNICTECVGLG